MRPEGRAGEELATVERATGKPESAAVQPDAGGRTAEIPAAAEPTAVELAEVARAAGRPAAPGASLPTRLLNRNFLLLWQGQAISQLGNQAFAVAMAYWILETTGSASLMGLLLAATSLPIALLAPVGGALADRFSRIRILIVCDAIAGLAMLVQALAMLSGRCSQSTLVALLFAVALTTGIVNSFFQPTLSAVIPDLVPADRLTAGNSLNQFSIQAAVLAGQGIGGVLFRMFGAPLLFLFDSLSFCVAAASEALVRTPPRPPHEQLGLGASVRQFVVSLREGFAYVRHTPGLLPYIAAPASYNFFTMAVFVLLPFFVQQNLHAGADWYGFLLATISFGMIAGFLLAGLVRFTGEARGRFLVVLIAVAPAPMLVTGFIHNRSLALALGFFLGTMLGLINVNLMTLLQANTPAEIRGRVMGLWTALVTGLIPLGMALGGIAGDLTGKNIPLVFTTCGALTLAITAVSLGLRSTRQYLSRV